VQTQTGTTKELLEKKANIDASNVGRNATAADGSVSDNSAAWGNALGTGAVESGNGKLVTGDTVYSEVRPQTDGDYVKKDSTTSANLTALDKQMKANTESIAENTDKITVNAQSIAKNTQNIETNAKGIATNAQNIETNAKGIAANAQNIETNAKGIAANAQNIETNTNDIKTNAQNIAANSQKIKTNAENINVARMIADDAMHGVSVLLVGTGLNVEDIIATDKKVNALAAQNGKIESSSNEFVRGQTVYEYLNGKDGEDGTLTLGKNTTKIAIGKGSKVTGSQSIAIGYGNQVTGAHSGAFGDPGTLDADNSYMIGNNNNITASGTAGFILGNDNVVSGANSYAIGSGNNISGSDTFVMGHNIDASVDNAVVLGKDSKAEAGAVSVGSDKEGGQRQIKHVADGTAATDAVTLGQMNSSVNRLDSKVNKVGAGAAALAALHPIDTDDKFSMGLGYGNYRDAHAAAIGMFYRPTDKIMISMGGTMGNGENLLNAGISFALDKGKGFGTSKAMLARQLRTQGEALEEQRKANAEQEAKIRTLQEENAAIKEQNAKLAARLAAIEAKLEK
jgi:hypothetical protein